MRTKRILIINADDLGYTQGVNQSIFRCHREGILRSATIMANGEAFQHAVAGVKDHPEMGIGIHLVLTELAPAAPAGEIQDLVDNNGKLPRSPGKLLKSILSHRISLASIQKEIHCQLSKVVDCGIQPTHLDTHKHVHVIPQVLSAIAALAPRFGIRWIRNPFDQSPLNPLLKTLHSEQRGIFLLQHAKALLTRVQRGSFFETLRKAGLRTPDSFFGVSLTGLWSPSAAGCLVERIAPGINEWMLHPGDCDSDLRNRSTRLFRQREEERDLLLSPQLKNLLQDEEVLLKHFGEVPPC